MKGATKASLLIPWQRSEWTQRKMVRSVCLKPVSRKPWRLHTLWRFTFTAYEWMNNADPEVMIVWKIAYRNNCEGRWKCNQVWDWRHCANFVHMAYLRQPSHTETTVHVNKKTKENCILYKLNYNFVKYTKQLTYKNVFDVSTQYY